MSGASVFKVNINDINVNKGEFIDNVRLKYSEPIKLQTCKYCGETFAVIRGTGRPLEYCCDECRRYARLEQSRLKSSTWYHKHKKDLSEKKRWGLGSGYISGNRNTDFEREYTIIKNELNRLKLR